MTQTMLIALLVVVLVLIVLFLLWGRSASAPSRPDKKADPSTSADEALRTVRSHAPSRPHQDLAGEQHYGEAIHALLLSAFTRLVENHPELRVPSLTSREIMHRVRLDDDARESLRFLVRAVELIVFAGRPASEDLYRRALDHHQNLMRSESASNRSGLGSADQGEAA